MRKLKNGSYEYIAGYVDDVMCYSKEPEKIIRYLEKSYTMKSFGYPQFYLGGDVVDLPPTWKDHNVFLDFQHTQILKIAPKTLKECVTQLSSHTVYQWILFITPKRMSLTSVHPLIILNTDHFLGALIG